jgi:hypothetical protein
MSFVLPFRSVLEKRAALNHCTDFRYFVGGKPSPCAARLESLARVEMRVHGLSGVNHGLCVAAGFDIAVVRGCLDCGDRAERKGYLHASQPRREACKVWFSVARTSVLPS